MKKIYLLRAQFNNGTYGTPALFTSKKIAEAWKKHMQKKFPEHRWFTYDEYPINFEPDK